MDNAAQIQQVLVAVSFVALGSLVIFQYLHYTIAAWRHWANHPNRRLLTGLVAVWWAGYGLFFLTAVPSFTSYVDALPLVLAGLYTPTVLALLGFASSPRFRAFVDRLSLRWLIESVEGPARVIVGVIFLFWYFAGDLPAVVAWVAGPGDILAGLLAFYAMRQLTPVANAADIKRPHWSITDALTRLEQPTRFRSHVWAAAGLVGFGVLDFIAAPASTAVSIAWGTVPEAMGDLPLAMIPLLLVPQVLVLEVLALRQFYVYWRRTRQPEHALREASAQG